MRRPSFFVITKQVTSDIFGEAGLLGEIRRVAQEEKREKEAKRMGFQNIISSKTYRNLREANKNLSQ